MSKFTVRVELHDADNDDYDTLHAAMKKKGFSRTIESGNGQIYHLPTAEYNVDGDYDTATVLDKAKSAANTTNLEYGVLVTESAGRKWYGLPKK